MCKPVMDYNITNSHAFCNTSSTLNETLSVCDTWYINMNGTYYIDDELVTHQCSVFGAFLLPSLRPRPALVQ